MNYRWGKSVTGKVIDKNGSIRYTIKTRRNGVDTETTRYEIRKKVKNETEELAEYIRWRKEQSKSRNLSIEIENKKPDRDYYYIVLCWEE